MPDIGDTRKSECWLHVRLSVWTSQKRYLFTCVCIGVWHFQGSFNWQEQDLAICVVCVYLSAICVCVIPVRHYFCVCLFLCVVGCLSVCVCVCMHMLGIDKNTQLPFSKEDHPLKAIISQVLLEHLRTRNNLLQVDKRVSVTWMQRRGRNSKQPRPPCTSWGVLSCLCQGYDTICSAVWEHAFRCCSFKMDVNWFSQTERDLTPWSVKLKLKCLVYRCTKGKQTNKQTETHC